MFKKRHYLNRIKTTNQKIKMYYYYSYAITQIHNITLVKSITYLFLLYTVLSIIYSNIIKFSVLDKNLLFVALFIIDDIFLIQKKYFLAERSSDKGWQNIESSKLLILYFNLFWCILCYGMSNVNVQICYLNSRLWVR